MARTRTPLTYATKTHVCLLAVLLVIAIATIGLVWWHARASCKTPTPPAPLSIPVSLNQALLPLPQTPILRKYPNATYAFQHRLSPPDRVDWRSRCPPVYNQGVFNDCTNQSTAFLVECFCKHRLHRAFRPSRWLLNYGCQRGGANEHDPYVGAVEAAVEGNLDTTGGVSDVYANVAALMMFGMVDEHLFPFPTPAQQKRFTQSRNDLRVRAEQLTKAPPSSTATAQFLRHYDAHLSMLPSPTAALETAAQRNRVTRCFVLDGTDVDTLRKCLAYEGPLAFDMGAPWWISTYNVQSYNATVHACRAVRDALKPAEGRDTTVRAYLTHLPTIARLIDEGRKSGDWSPRTVPAACAKLSGFSYEWLHLPQAPLSARARRVFRKALHTYQRTHPADTRRAATIRYPHRQEAVHMRALNKYGDRAFDKIRRAVLLKETSKVPLSVWKHPFATLRKTHPDVDAAMTYFTQQVEGGHSMALVGYDNQRRVFIVRNSFGTDWGDQGYCYLSYDFFNARRFNPLRATGWWVGQVVGVGGVELGVE